MQDDALLFSVLGYETDTVADGGGRGTYAHLAAVYQDLAAVRPLRPAYELHRLAAAGADKPGKTQYLAPVELKTDMLYAVAGEVARFEHHLPRLLSACGEALVQLTPDHEAHELAPVGIGCVQRLYEAAVSQDADALRYLEHLVHPVRDIHHCDAALLELADDGKQQFHFVGR